MKTTCCFLLCSAQNLPPLCPPLRWYVSPLPHTPLAHPHLSHTSPTAPFFPVISLLYSSISSFLPKMAAVSLSGLHPLVLPAGCLLPNMHLLSKDEPRLLTFLCSHTAPSTPRTPTLVCLQVLLQERPQQEPQQ